MKKLILTLVFLLAIPVPAQAAVPQSIKRADDIYAVAVETDRALDALLKLGIWALRRNGHHDAADQLEREHKEWGSFFTRKAMLKELGDHDPYSAWLAVAYEVLRYYLGDTLMEFLHLDDIRILNFAIPVVFDPAIAFHKEDYLQHWTPFWGVVSYWVTWAGCQAGTWGTGWFLICTPAGMLSERVTIRWIAPPIGSRVYDRWSNNGGF